MPVKSKRPLKQQVPSPEAGIEALAAPGHPLEMSALFQAPTAQEPRRELWPCPGYRIGTVLGPVPTDRPA